MERRTVFSACRKYRYVLWRQWDEHNPDYAMIIGLNPSTADEVEDDPTIRRCVDFSRRWGYGALCMVNLFAYCATDPARLKRCSEPIGIDNNHWLVHLAADAGVIVAAWGVHGSLAGRDQAVKRLLPGRLSCLGLTREGHPRHPLYLKQSLFPSLWTSGEVKAERVVDCSCSAK